MQINKNEAVANREAASRPPMTLMSVMLIMIIPAFIIIVLMYWIIVSSPQYRYEITGPSYELESREFSLDVDHKGLDSKVVGQFDSCRLPTGAIISHLGKRTRHPLKYRDNLSYFVVRIPRTANLEASGCPSFEFTYFGNKAVELQRFKRSGFLEFLGRFEADDQVEL